MEILIPTPFTVPVIIIALNRWKPVPGFPQAVQVNLRYQINVPGEQHKCCINGCGINNLLYLNNELCTFCILRIASMPNTGLKEEYYKLRHFSIIGKGVVNRGDSLKSRRSRSNNSVTSSNSRYGAIIMSHFVFLLIDWENYRYIRVSKHNVVFLVNIFPVSFQFTKIRFLLYILWIFSEFIWIYIFVNLFNYFFFEYTDRRT